MNVQGFFKIDDLGYAEAKISKIDAEGRLTVDEAVGVIERHIENNLEWVLRVFGDHGRFELVENRISLGRACW